MAWPLVENMLSNNMKLDTYSLSLLLKLAIFSRDNEKVWRGNLFINLSICLVCRE
jgi:hypothetical protein